MCFFRHSDRLIAHQAQQQCARTLRHTGFPCVESSSVSKGYQDEMSAFGRTTTRMPHLSRKITIENPPVRAITRYGCGGHFVGLRGSNGKF